MSRADHVFIYCERGNDPGVFAEPLNAVTNAAFLIAAVAAAAIIAGQPAEARRPVHVVLVVLLVLIGVGSFLFHTFATRWAGLADVLPIFAFMLIYVAVAMRTFFRMPVAAAALITIAFAATLWAAGQLRCPPETLVAFGGAGPRCLNGSVGYMPALAAMLVAGAALRIRRHAAAAPLLLAGVVFALSLTFRSIDQAACPRMAVGTHFLWHLLNATTLFLLTRAIIVDGSRPPRRPSSSRQRSAASPDHSTGAAAPRR